MAEDAPAISTSYARMQEQGLFRDPLPKITPSGKSTTIFDDSVQKDLESDIYFPLPLTPRRLQKFRRNYKPGEINVHWGLEGQKLPPKDFAYGCRGNAGVSAAATLAAGKKEGIAEYMQMRGESIYASTKREPLGRCIDRGYKWPQETQQPGFEFGKREDVEDITGKEVLFPRNLKPDDEATRQQYVRTHGNYAPGEMVDRQYNWPVDPKDFAFGVTDKNAY